VSDFGHIHYAIMAEVIFFLNYNGVILRLPFILKMCLFISIQFFFYRNKKAQNSHVCLETSRMSRDDNGIKIF